MKIRKAEEKDIKRILDLLSQVLEVHAALRPDLFITGTTKYEYDELLSMIHDTSRLIYVAVDDNDFVLGYAICEIRENGKRNNQVSFKYIYIDDLCVDEAVREKHVGQKIFEYVRNEAQLMGCYNIALNVWEGNTPAKKFYEKMGFKAKSTTMEFFL